MTPTIAEISDLSLCIGKKSVLDDITIPFRKGESVLIAGRNGAGKSTFLRCLAGVIFPDRGSIAFPEGLRKNRIGFISDRLSLFENFTLQQGIAFHSRVYGIRDFDESLLNDLKLDRRQRIKRLSVGERVLYHLSLVVAQKPELLLVDEIIHAIDPYLRSYFLEVLIDLIERYQTTIIMVNHTFSDVEKIPERILIMDRGRFVVDEDSESLRSRVKKVITSGPLPAEIPCIYARETSFQKEYFVYPFEENFRELSPYSYDDLDLNAIMKAFIGGQYAKERIP